MKDFASWFTELKENTLFWDRMCLKHSGKNLNLVAQNVYDWLVAKEENKDIIDCRVLFDRFAASHPKDAVNVIKSPVEESKKEEPQPVPRESKEYMEWTNKALAEIAKSKTVNYFPGKSYSERAEDGGVCETKAFGVD